MGVKPATEPVASVPVEGVKADWPGYPPFGIDGTLFEPRRLDIEDGGMPILPGMGCPVVSIIGQNWLDVSNVGFWRYVSQAS